MKSARGMTLVEILMVVAIIGVLSSMAVASISEFTTFGRVNGATDALATVLSTARQKAITEHCTYVVQINGRRYSPVAAPVDVPRRPNTVLLYRKNNCASTIGAYEPGVALAQRDRLVSEVPLNGLDVDLVFPAVVLAVPTLTTQSVSIAWTGNGTRSVYADDDADGASVDKGYGLDLTVAVNPAARVQPTRNLLIPVAGSSKAL